MITSHKQMIVAELEKLAQKESQTKIARKAGVSTATISQMINHNWDLIRDEMWQKVKINLHINWDWCTADTGNLKAISQLLSSAQKRSMSIAVSHDAGAGKSHAYRLYARTLENVIYVECKNYWTKKSYARQLCIACGVDDSGTVENLIERFIHALKSMNKALVIIDQIDKLKDSQLDLFMDFYNELDGHCGFMLSGVPAFEKRVRRGCQLNKIGYRELYSRVGKKFIHLRATTEADVAKICKANGIDDEQFVNEIFNTCEGDLRRVRRSIDQYFLLKEIA